MLSSTKLNNQYCVRSGRIVRKHDLNPESTSYLRNLELYRNNVQTLFDSFATYIKTANLSLLDKAGFEELFRTLVRQGAPAEAMVCSAAFLTIASDEHKEVNENGEQLHFTCEEWDTSIDQVLQFAVIEFLTDMSGLAKEKWQIIINKLLALGANPQFETPNPLFTTPFTSNPDKGKIVVDLRLKDIVSILLNTTPITPEIKILFLNCLKCLKNLNKSIDAKQIDDFLKKFQDEKVNLYKDSVFTTLEELYPKELSEFLYQQGQTLVKELAQRKDFDSINYLRERYGVNVFPPLIEIEQKDVPWTYTAIFGYLEKTFPNELIAYTRENADKVVRRLSLGVLVYGSEFKIIDELKAKYGFDTFSELMQLLLQNTETPWFGSALWSYMEERFHDRLYEALALPANVDLLVKKFLEKKDDAALDRLAEYPFFRINQVIEYIYNHSPKEDVDSTVPVPCCMKSSLYREVLFQRIDKINPQAFAKYSLTLSTHFGRKLFNRTGSDTAYRHNIDMFRYYPDLSYRVYAKYNSYYHERAQFLLDFIYEQYQPKNQPQPKEDKNIRVFDIKSKIIVISPTLQKMVEALQAIINSSPSSSTELYKQFLELLKKPTFLQNASEYEKQIFTSCVEGFVDNTPISQYMRNRFDLKNYAPFFAPFIGCFTKPKPGLFSKPPLDTPLENLKKDPLFDKSLIPLIFTFLGGRTVNEQTGEQTHTRPGFGNS